MSDWRDMDGTDLGLDCRPALVCISGSGIPDYKKNRHTKKK
jgi:hypothetical protein